MIKMERIDAQIESALQEREAVIGDDGFSESVISALPSGRLSRTTARRWTLGGAAVLGSILTSVLGAPLETAFSTFVLEGGLGLAAVAAILVAGILTIPVAWVFFSR